MIGAGGVAVGGPRIESVLSHGEVGERPAVAEEFSAQPTVKPFDFAGCRRTARGGQQMFDAVFAADGVEEDLHRGWLNRPVNTLPLSVRICCGAP